MITPKFLEKIVVHDERDTMIEENGIKSTLALHRDETNTRYCDCEDRYELKGFDTKKVVFCIGPKQSKMYRECLKRNAHKIMR